MTAPLDIERLEELEREATKGPWSLTEETTIERMCGQWSVPLAEDGELKPQDAALIVALRNAAPHLLAIAKAAKEYRDAKHAVSTLDCDTRPVVERFYGGRAALLAAVDAAFGEAIQRLEGE